MSRGQTRDEMYFGTGDAVPADLTARASAARRARADANRSAACGTCSRIIASALGIPITRYTGSESGPAFGAARLARIAATGDPIDTVCTKPPILDVTEPDLRLHEAYRENSVRFRRLYRALREEFKA